MKCLITGIVLITAVLLFLIIGGSILADAQIAEVGSGAAVTWTVVSSGLAV